MEEEKKESNIDIKGTVKKFIVADEPELEQEEAIMKYGEQNNSRKIKPSNNDDDSINGNSEEEEHLKRIKAELLASLKRVERLEDKIFREDLFIDETRKRKMRSNKNGGKGSSIKTIEEVSQVNTNENQKERE